MKKKTVLITGAGRGLGKSIAELYHKAGFFVVATDINLDLFSDLLENENYLFLQMDVSSEKSVKQCSKILSTEIDHLDVLISNAGVFDFYSVSEAGGDELKKIVDVNVLGLANLTKYFLPVLVPKNSRLIVISSESYKVPSPFQPYSVSKQMLESLYKAISIELSIKDIKCVLIRPGAMQTKIIDETIEFNRIKKNSIFTNEFRGFLETVPKYIGNIASPERVAKVVFNAGTIKKPKTVYHINHNPIVGILSIMPQTFQNILLKRSLKTK